jgi:hypothetical protein
VIDGYQRKAAAPGESCSKADSDQKGADEARARRHGDHFDRPVHHLQRPIHEIWQGLEVFSRGKLWNYSPIGRMRLNLAGQQAHLDLSVAIYDRYGTLVTRCLDAYSPKHNAGPNVTASPTIRPLTRWKRVQV